MVDSVTVRDNVSARGTLKDNIAMNDEFIPLDILITSNSRRITEIIVDLFLCLAIAIFGIIANTLVIIVFAKQGFNESVNISMTTVSIWDLIKCLGASMQRMSGPLYLFSRADAESWTNISTVVFSSLTCFSTYVTSVLAAYVAVERCLCVSLPFKAKWLLTPKVTFSACVIISVVVFGLFAVMFGIYDVIWVFSDRYNNTVAIYKHNNFYHTHLDTLFEYYNLSGIIWPTASFLVIGIATTIIVIKLKESSKFRSGQGKVKASSSNQLSLRDKQVVTMLVVIIAVYVFCLAPRIAVYIAKNLIYDFYFLRKYHNLFMFVSYFVYILDLSNGACNFMVFYAMSSSFRTTFLQLFGTRKGNGKIAATTPMSTVKHRKTECLY